MFPSIFGIILKTKNPGLKRDLEYEPKLWGKQMLEWVVGAMSGYPFVTLNYNNEKDILQIVKEQNPSQDYVAVVFSDTPLLQHETIKEAVELSQAENLDVCRMARGYLIRTSALPSITSLNRAKRYYFSSENDFLTARDMFTFSLISEIMKQRILRAHMDNGVFFVDPNTSYVDAGVVIGKNATIYPNNYITGNTVIGDNVTLKANNTIKDSIIGDNAVIEYSVLDSCRIGKNTTVGPYAYLRPSSNVGENCRVGDFVEIKNSTLGDNTKASHHAYIGDSELGRECNVGCGVVFCNYDGKNKHRSIVGNNVFIGSNCNIVSPVTIDDGAFLAAGSTITEDIPKDSLAIARARQVNKPLRKKSVEEENGNTQQ